MICACRPASCRSCRSASAETRGTNLQGPLSFHGEKTPSFHVDPEKGFFHCFGCGVGGDVFKFLELHEKAAFPDAVRMLAQKFGVALPEMAEGDDNARQDAALREALLKARNRRRLLCEQLASRPACGRGNS